MRDDLLEEAIIEAILRDTLVLNDDRVQPFGAVDQVDFVPARPLLPVPAIDFIVPLPRRPPMDAHDSDDELFAGEVVELPE